jgi:hypothetical protein
LASWFDNEEGYKEEVKLDIPDIYFEPMNVKTSSQVERQKYILENLKSQVDNITKQGHKLILVYPVPEMGFNVPRNLLRKFVKEGVSADDTIPILSGSYDVYKKRNKLIFETLDSIENPNVYRVYPHKFFCDKQEKNRCVANDQENLFYFDDDHVSLKGSEFIANEIIRQIKIMKINNY